VTEKGDTKQDIEKSMKDAGIEKLVKDQAAIIRKGIAREKKK